MQQTYSIKSLTRIKLSETNLGQVGPKSSRPGSAQPGQLGLYGGPGMGEG